MTDREPPDFVVDMSDAELVRDASGNPMLPDNYHLWPAFETQTDLQIAECYWHFRLKAACVKAVAKARRERENGTD